jgi:uncharacterized protein YheU (UPF0270 family)
VDRDGTDTSYTDGSLEKNVEMVIRQLKRGDVFIVFDEVSGIAYVVPKEEVKSIEISNNSGSLLLANTGCL